MSGLCSPCFSVPHVASTHYQHQQKKKDFPLPNLPWDGCPLSSRANVRLREQTAQQEQLTKKRDKSICVLFGSILSLTAYPWLGVPRIWVRLTTAGLIKPYVNALGSIARGRVLVQIRRFRRTKVGPQPSISCLVVDRFFFFSFAVVFFPPSRTRKGWANRALLWIIST